MRGFIMARKDNIFLNQLMAKMPPEIDNLPVEEQLQLYCELYLHFSNRLTKWCGDEIEEHNDLQETVDILCEIVMYSIMEQHGYTKDEDTDLWSKSN